MKLTIEQLKRMIKEVVLVEQKKLQEKVLKAKAAQKKKLAEQAATGAGVVTPTAPTPTPTKLTLEQLKEIIREVLNGQQAKK